MRSALNQPYLMESSVMMETLCIWAAQYSSHMPHATCGQQALEMWPVWLGIEFLILWILMNLNSNSHMGLAATGRGFVNFYVIFHLTFPCIES